MKSIDLPLGTGLPIGVVIVIEVGVFEYCATIASASATPAEDDELAALEVVAAELELLLDDDEPHAASPAHATSAASPSRIRLLSGATPLRLSKVRLISVPPSC